MTPEEIETALSDLSNRMERVRALYEQYFMGIERLEPTIPRKDLDRRLEVLRKTPFQNTAKRFKFQTLIQRYTALQQYWYRTCRDIENGTYRKHVKKAQRRFEGEEPTRSPEDQAHLAQEGAARARSVKEQTEADLGSLLDSNIDLTAELGDMLAAFNVPAPAAKTGTSLLGKLNKASPAPVLSSDADSGSATVGAKPLVSPKPLLSPKPLAPLKPLLSPKPLTPQPPLSPKPLAPLKPLTSPQPAPINKPINSPPAPAPLKPLTQLNSPAPRPLPSTPDRTATPPRPVAKPPQPSPPNQAATPPARPPAPTPPSPLQSAARTQASGLSEERIRAIHAQYQHARAETKATAVSYEKLEKNLRETEAQLRATHRGKNVDFEVAIKDGKAILKPRLK